MARHVIVSAVFAFQVLTAVCPVPNSCRNQSDLYRYKRQSWCRKDEWHCRDGSCIPFVGKCDGAIDCPDASDETHALCWNMQCQTNQFRCAYGACVDGTAPCSSTQECADGSDELLPRCRNEIQIIKGKFTCKNGKKIPSRNLCDGMKNCGDGSDETLKSCAGRRCAPNRFQCEYGACVDANAECNKDGTQQCADGSDEAEDLCNATESHTEHSVPMPVILQTPTTTPKCILPEYPKNGSYVVSGHPGARPGQAFDAVTLTVACEAPYRPNKDGWAYCSVGHWYSTLPECELFCKLNQYPSVTYTCKSTDPTILSGDRQCNEYEPTGTEVHPRCNENYRHSGVLDYMYCVDGSWDHVAICESECGTVTPKGETLVANGVSAKRNEFPWHAGIYSKRFTPYMQICGGTLVSTLVVISAAHCFWDETERLRSAKYFAVGMGKLYRNWDIDEDGLKSAVKEIKVPERYSGVSSHFQDDIALLILSTAVKLAVNVRPACLDFDVAFDKRQLRHGNVGKVAGWGLTSADGDPSQVLKVADFPYVDVRQCIEELPSNFRKYITSDKICAGTTTGTVLCKGDSGGGLVFPEQERGVERWYLRGVASTAPSNEHSCNTNTYIAFTHIIKHYSLIDYIIWK